MQIEKLGRKNPAPHSRYTYLINLLIPTINSFDFRLGKIKDIILRI